ncbi:MAG: bifunctional N(6)-L-threonylcarbamoyladenine synthase/serine/threonine protein kinase [Promethearchaeota archaeon]
MRKNTSESYKICLGIESTAHTFGVGIVDFTGNVLARVNDTYVPDSGGLHPRKVVEHHHNVFLDVIKRALKEADLSIKDIDLIAFSQGPGLGPCLRIGAGVARTLAQKLKVPLIGVNHCVGHVEIGRRVSGAKDPLTLYVSGGNTMVNAFESGRYQVFGETLDIAVGNMIDMVAREMGLPHPGGPKIEKMARAAKRYLKLPYVVKGMDLSFSGIFTYCKNLINSPKYGFAYTAEDVAYSLQETAFAMLTEVTERALAHTEKSEVLLTGGVAANKRLQEMIKYISEEHGAKFHVVPLKLAGDNGAMIAWVGILYYLNNGGMEIKDTQVDPKWRMDEVFTPWRLPNHKISGLEFVNTENINNLENRHYQNLNENSLKNDVRKQNGLNAPQKGNNDFNASDKYSRHMKKLKGIILDSEDIKIIKMGAEALLIKKRLFDHNTLVKYRLSKGYRIKEIDQMVRSERTLAEARTLIRLKKQGIPVPMVFDIDPKNASISMSFIEGQPLKTLLETLGHDKLRSIFSRIGAYIAKMHKIGQIHGDLTTSNIIYNSKNDNIFFIDFGLGFTSSTTEDRMVDLHLFKRVITSTHGNYFNIIYPPLIQGYANELKVSVKFVEDGIEQIELRGRYVKKEKRKRGKIK